MKVNLNVVAVCLSCIAIVISLAFPLYDYIVSLERQQEQETPSFDLDFLIVHTYTLLRIENNGTATAHNIEVRLMFEGSALPSWETTEFIPEIERDVKIYLYIPIGKYQLETAIPEGNWFTNATFYEAHIYIFCNELDLTSTFHFENIIS